MESHKIYKILLKSHEITIFWGLWIPTLSPRTFRHRVVVAWRVPQVAIERAQRAGVMFIAAAGNEATWCLYNSAKYYENSDSGW
jgi:hypothetical protein